MREVYYLLFYFWVRADVFTKTREHKAWKALVAMTLVQVWAVLGLYIWAEVLVEAPLLRKEAAWGVVFVLFVVNYRIFREGKWEDYEKKYLAYSAGGRSARMALAAVVIVAAFVLLLTGFIALRSRSDGASDGTDRAARVVSLREPSSGARECERGCPSRKPDMVFGGAPTSATRAHAGLRA